MHDIQGLKSRLSKWNGKSKAQIEQIYANFSHDLEFSERLISFFESSQYLPGITWLLKRYLEEGNELGGVMTSRIVGNLNLLTEWQARLHVLQSFDYLALQINDAKKVKVFAHRGINHHNKFVRAWSYHVLFVVATQHDQFKGEVIELLNLGLLDEAASVKARIRALLHKSKI